MGHQEVKLGSAVSWVEEFNLAGLRLRRRRPRSFLEWQTLRRWHKLPEWEDEPPGYLLREMRERAGLTQTALAQRLGCSQQAVTQAERWQANPTVRLMAEWAAALGQKLVVSFR